ncbi:MAG: tetratricopeptide repeat protein [Acidobacteria bacterium]|nr:tetratricopeptide repeat protein [Acidobacteriota bacterium]
MKTIICCVLAAVLLAVPAGASRIDELTQSLQTASEAEKPSILNDLAVAYLDVSPKDALPYAHQALEISERQDNHRQAATALKTLGVAHIYLSNFTDAAAFTERCLTLARRENFHDLVSACLNNLGVIYRFRSDYKKSLEYYFEALALMESQGNQRLVGLAHSNIGTIYYFWGDYDKALEYYFQALRIREEIADRAGIADTLNNIAVIYDEMKQYQLALEYYQKSLRLFEELGDQRGIVNPLNNMGVIYYVYFQDYDQSLEYHQRALKIRREIRDRLGEAVSLNNLGNLYRAQGDGETALRYYLQAMRLKEELGEKAELAVSLRDIGDLYRERGQYELALDYTRRALVLAEEVEAGKDIRLAYRDLSEIYATMGDHARALEYYKQYNELENRMLSEETAGTLARLQAGKAVEGKEKEIELLQREQAAQRNLRNFLMVISVLIVGISLLLYNRYRLKKKSNLELQAKSDQIQAQKEKLETLNAILEERNKEYYISSIMDPLTELYNRTYILDALNKEFSRSRRHHTTLAVIFMDLDHFKTVNDRYGHMVGDYLLKHIANHLREEIRVEDVLGRYGGEEFLLILPNTDLAGARRVADKIRDKIERTVYHYGEEPLSITISQGIADLAAHQPCTAGEFLAMADAALYQAKEAGRNRTEIYTPPAGT